MELDRGLTIERVAEMAKYAIPLLFSIVGYYVSTQVAPINIRVERVERANEQLITQLNGLSSTLSVAGERIAGTHTLLKSHLESDQRHFATREELGRLRVEIVTLRERLAALSGSGHGR